MRRPPLVQTSLAFALARAIVGRLRWRALATMPNPARDGDLGNVVDHIGRHAP